MNFWYTNLVFWERWSGKTYYFVREARRLQKEWEIIISNVWMDFPHIRFRNSWELVEILREIAEYAYYEATPMIAPRNYLKAYKIKRKKGTPLRFFILFDEIGIHLNHRNWSRSFKEDFLRDMLMEPRKYWMTIVWICQEWETVDKEFRIMCNDWFSVKKAWFWLLDRTQIKHYYVRGGEMLRDNVYDKGKIPTKWNYFQRKKDLSEFSGWLYYTREIQGAGAKMDKNTPSLFHSGTIFSLKNPVSEISTEESPEGVEPTGEEYGGTGAPPA